MPELPEVERLRQSLIPRLSGRVVRAATVHRRDVLVLPGDPPGGFSRRPAGSRTRPPKRLAKRLLLVGQPLTRIDRHGKQLALCSDEGACLCIHLGMSGQLLWRPPGRRLPDTTHLHVTIRLDDGSRLVFRDPRRFGGIWAFERREDLRSGRWGELGPDALGISAARLSAALATSRAPLKARLLDQSAIAGLGNIYADEALHRAGIRPDRRAGSLTSEETDRLAASIRETLRAAIDVGGSSFRDYIDADGERGSFTDLHRVYGRGGEACHGCGNGLLAATLAQRTTVFCPSCQT